MAMLSRFVALSVSLTRKVSRCRAEGGETEAFKRLFEGFEPPAAGLPRFFRLVQGQLDEIVGFGPADLDVQSVCMLDVVSEMFVWLGAESVAADSKVAEAVAEQYLADAPDGRAECPITAVLSGQESPAFLSHFVGWTGPQADPFEAKLNQLGVEPPVSAATVGLGCDCCRDSDNRPLLRTALHAAAAERGRAGGAAGSGRRGGGRGG